MEKGKTERLVTREPLERAFLLCSEDTADGSHRRLVAERLENKLNGGCCIAGIELTPCRSWIRP